MTGFDPAVVARIDQRIAHGHDTLAVMTREFNSLRKVVGDTAAIARMVYLIDKHMSKESMTDLLVIAVLELADRQGDGNV